MRHPLVKLAGEIDWSFLEQRCEDVPGRPPLPRRRACPGEGPGVGLTILNDTHDLFDGALCDRWVEQPYFQYFCGQTVFQYDLPLDRSSLTRWRQRIEAEPLQGLL